jgi:hypothetical protein
MGKRVASVLRVESGGRYLGDVLLDRRGRVWRRATTVPPEVALKALVSRTRQGAAAGEVQARNGEVFTWRLLGGEPQRTTAA